MAIIGRLADELFPTTGFETERDFEKAIVGAREKLGVPGRLFQDFDENFAVAMARPEGTRWYLSHGIPFVNQHVSGSSRGGNDPETRDAAEAFMKGMDFQAARSLDGDLKAKYGFLMTSPFQKGRTFAMGAVSIYGDDIYLFRAQARVDRKSAGGRRLVDYVTWTPGDSLQRAGRALEGRTTLDEISLGRAPSPKPLSWDEAFLPLAVAKTRNLLLPFLEGDFSEAGPVRNVDFSPLDLGRVAGLKQRTVTKLPFVELQFHLPNLDLEHVSDFLFTRNPPEGLFLEKLLEHGIRIFQVKGDGIEPWRGKP